MTTTTFTNVTVPVGTNTVGPASASDTETALTFIFDRTNTGGLNSLTSSTTFGLVVNQSNDGGATWFEIGGFTTTGGLIPKRGGGSYTANTFSSTLAAGTSRKLEAVVTVGGPSSVVTTVTVTTT